MVVAPHSMPTMSGRLTGRTRQRPRAMTVPMTMTPRLHRLAAMLVAQQSEEVGAYVESKCINKHGKSECLGKVEHALVGA